MMCKFGVSIPDHTDSEQEFLKVPHVGPIPKVIHLEVYLDMATSSFEDVTRAIRGQRRLINYQRRNGRKCSEKSFYMFSYLTDA